MKTHGLIHALLVISLLQLSRLGLVSAIDCSYGKDENGLISVIHNQVLNLRQGETFIFDCVGEPELHRKLTLRYNEESCHAEFNKTTLEYTWYCVINSDGALNVWGIDHQENTDINPLFTINIKSYDLTNSHITTEHTTSSSTTASSVGDGRVDQNLQNQSSTEEPIHVANAEKFYLMGAVVILGVVVMALFITVLLMAVTIHRLKNKPTSVEDGKSGYTEEDHAMQTRRNSSGTDQMQSTAHDVESENQAHSPEQGDADQIDVDVQSKAHVESDDQAHSIAQSHTDRETEEETHSSAHDRADQVDVDSDDSILDNSTTKIKV